ncbi:MAG: hypothetical protein ACRD2X_19575 [Vicinamibacteraceae bacterium]
MHEQAGEQLIGSLVLGAERLAYYQREIMRLLNEEYGDAPLLVLKEPRICRLSPLYEDSFASLDIEPRYILIHRNPLAVISSLARRNGMTGGFAGLLWLRHVLDADVATRGKSRTFLSYEDLMEDWREAIERVGTALDVSWPRSVDEAAADVEAYVSSDLRHHHPTFVDLEANRDIPSWIKKTYAALQALESAGEEGSAPLAALTRVRQEFDAAAPIFGGATFPEITTRDGRLRSELEERDRQLSEAAAAKLRDQIDAIYRSRSWRVPAPIRAALTGLRRMRLYLGCPVAAHPRSGLRAAFADRRVADSMKSDDAPQFDLAWPGPHPLPPGRYFLKIQVPPGEQDLRSPRLYIDSGAGHAESAYIDLRFRRTRANEYAVPVALPHGAVRLRFHAGATGGEYAPGRMRIRRVVGFGARSE